MDRASTWSEYAPSGNASSSSRNRAFHSPFTILRCLDWAEDAAGPARTTLSPVARIPSTGRGSMPSTASLNSLPSTPVVCTKSASVPANGPSPTATMKMKANTISLIARSASRPRRTGWRTHQGLRFAALSNPSGTAAITARKEPHNAICSVTASWRRHSAEPR